MEDFFGGQIFGAGKLKAESCFQLTRRALRLARRRQRKRAKRPGHLCIDEDIPFLCLSISSQPFCSTTAGNVPCRRLTRAMKLKPRRVEFSDLGEKALNSQFYIVFISQIR